MRLRRCGARPLALVSGLLLCALARAADPWTLERALSQALIHGPDARIAIERVAAARAGIEQAEAAFRPALRLESSYLRTNNPMLAFGALLNQREFSPTLDFNDVPDLDDLNVRGVFTVPLYHGGRLDAGRDAARASADAAAAGADAIRNELAFEVVRTFHTVLKTREYIGAADSAVRAFEGHLGIAAKRVAAGTALRTDLLDLEVRLAQAREDLVRARNAHEIAQRSLRNLLGIEPSDFAVAEIAPEPEVPPERTPPNRPELAAIRQLQQAAEAHVRESRSTARPRVNAVGVLDYDRGSISGGYGSSYTAGVMAEWDLWDGKRSASRVAEASSNLARLREEERKLILAIELETAEARSRLAEARERLVVTQATVRQAEESVGISRARFEQGLVLVNQLIDAETALTSARVRRVEADSDRRLAVASLRRALGLPQLEARP